MKLFGDDSEPREMAPGSVDELRVDSALAGTELSSKQRSDYRKATVLNAVLSAFGGSWLMAVPVASVLTGATLSFELTMSLTAGLGLSLYYFVSEHPFIPVNYRLRHYGIEAIRRRDGLRRHLTLEFLHPSPEALRRIKEDRELWAEAEGASRLLRSELRAERRLQRQETKLRAIRTAISDSQAEEARGLTTREGADHGRRSEH